MDLSMSIPGGIGAYLNYNYYTVDWHDDSLEIEPFLMELTPEHRLNAGLMYSIFAGTILALESRAAISRNSKSGLAMDDYFVVNFGIEQLLFNKRLMVNIRTVNVFDIGYQEIYGYPMPGRTIVLNSSINL